MEGASPKVRHGRFCSVLLLPNLNSTSRTSGNRQGLTTPLIGRVFPIRSDLGQSQARGPTARLGDVDYRSGRRLEGSKRYGRRYDDKDRGWLPTRILVVIFQLLWTF
jgi:hypothetical protein